MSNWLFYSLGSALFAALTTILGKFGVSEINSNLATFIRTIVILVVSALLVSFRHEWQRPESLSTKGIFFLVASGLTSGLSWLCYYRALQLGPVSKVAPIDKLSVVFAICFALLFLGERITWKIGLGTILIGAGASILAM